MKLVVSLYACDMFLGYSRVCNFVSLLFTRKDFIKRKMSNKWEGKTSMLMLICRSSIYNLNKNIKMFNEIDFNLFLLFDA